MPDKFEVALEKFMEANQGKVTSMQIFLAGWKRGLEEAQEVIAREIATAPEGEQKETS